MTDCQSRIFKVQHLCKKVNCKAAESTLVVMGTLGLTLVCYFKENAIRNGKSRFDVSLLFQGKPYQEWKVIVFT